MDFISKLHDENVHTTQNDNINIKHDFTRILKNDTPRLKYYKNGNKLKSVIHWGQRKLLMVEIEFLTNFSDEYDTVLYAGAAPGNHIYTLAKMFPTLKFILFDVNEFSVKQTNNIKIYKQYFTDETAKLFENRDDILFISDIRTAQPLKMGPEEIELRVEKDNNSQKDWYKILNCKKTMLKCRLPWSVSPYNKFAKKDTKKTWVTEGGEKFCYLKGDIYIQPWAPQSSTEFRLVLGPYDKNKGPEMTVYNNTEYEEKMFYFNNCIRPSIFEHNVKLTGLDKCYDCTSEVYILTRYLERYSEPEVLTSNRINKEVAELSKSICKSLGNKKLLSLINI